MQRASPRCSFPSRDAVRGDLGIAEELLLDDKRLDLCCHLFGSLRRLARPGDGGGISQSE
jgi:hypothetical protein